LPATFCFNSTPSQLLNKSRFFQPAVEEDAPAQRPRGP
jgi:hypothetical protein